MSLLTITQTICKRVGVTSPSIVIGNADQNIVRLLNILEEEGQELSERHRWQALTKEASFTTAATISQGLVSTIATDIAYFKNDTFFNRNSNVPVIPVDDVTWQRMQANTASGPYPNLRIFGKTVYMYPVPTAGESVFFEYISKNWCASSGGTGQTAWAADADVGVLDEELMAQGGVWRWKKSMGFDYGEDFRQYEQRIQNAIARDIPRGRILMRGSRNPHFISKGNIEDGSWTL